MPTAKAIAIHVLVQLPKNLIDGENPDTLLKYARGFVETVFGSHAIFADRVDRDEKGRTNVDLFVTPKYLKRTKHTEKLAVSMTRDLKAVADKYGRKQHKWDTGRALQDALYDYLKNTVGLEGVKRGEPKKFAGSDWETAEQLRMEELAEKERQIEAELRRARAAAAKAEHDGILLEQSRAEAERIVLEADERARIAMQEQERTNHEVEDIKAALKRQEDELAKRTAEVAENGRKALVDAEASRQNRIATEAALAEATAHREARQADRETDAQKRALHQKQLALVARASDDANGLDLRIASNTFTMSSSKMTEDEKVTQATKWPDYIIAIARTIATTLQKLRDMAASLAQRELVMAKRDAALDKREAELKHNQATYAADRAEHEKRLVQFNVRTSRLTEAEKAAEKAAAKVAAEAQKKLQDAEFDAFVTKAEREEQNKWFTAMQALEALSEEVSVSPNGRISVTPNAERALPAAVADLLKKEPPEWATWLVGQRHDLAAAKRKADESTQAADAAAQELAAMIEQAGPLLTPAKKPIVSEAQQVLARHGFPPPDFGV
ncbi:hypothetical protein DL238_09745 [Alteriqipengyuania lutimaris]|uniref:Uncharacterized protein n=1 Tax=Alteriqipengyuania lutimaris TaxID=1538146 RepID=A0A395LM73_9SPHN|nr:hypothetical protein DL238_09745 [Alteriqipengyuania lutimaris]